jgi:DNA-binding winged helix-turn-helix (wHTH) protein
VTLPPSRPVTASTTEYGVWRFDEFVLDVPRFELRRNGVAIRVEPQVFDVMVALVRNHKRLVAKDELFDTVWGDRFVSEAALTSRIKAARRALGDDGGSQRYIRTVRGRGYQFVGKVLDPDNPHANALPVAVARPAGSQIVGYQINGQSEILLRLALVNKTEHRCSARQVSGRGRSRYRRLTPSTKRRVFHGPPR